MCVCVCVCVCLASGEHKAELLFIRLQKSGCVLCCSCRLYVCSSASLSLSLSLFIPRSVRMIWSISVGACVAHFHHYTLPVHLSHLVVTHKLLFFCTFPNIKTNTRPLIQSHVVSFSPHQQRHILQMAPSTGSSFLTISAMFSFRSSHLTKAFQ